MKIAFSVLSVLLLCSCSGMPPMQVQSSVNGSQFVSGPTSFDDPRLRDPRFYMNDDASPTPMAAPAPSRFGQSGSYCVADCQARHYPAGYCAQVCN